MNPVEEKFNGENNRAHKLGTLGEMASVNDKHSYFHDEDTGWIHMKLIELDDRQHKDGEDDIETLDFFNDVTYKIKGFPHMVGTPSKDGLLDDNVQNRFGAIYRWNMGQGQNILSFELENVYTDKDTGKVYTNEDEFEPSKFEQNCDDFSETIFVACPDGFEVGPNNDCVDINECQSGSHNCVEPATCENIDASYECNCPEGYEKGADGFTCDNIIECDTNNGGCSHICTDTDGSFECGCLNSIGWKLDVDEKTCVDVDECVTVQRNFKVASCPGNSTCDNTIGSYVCNCNDGYVDKARMVNCVNIDECAGNPCHKNAICTDIPGSFICECKLGLWGDGIEKCKDIDECDLENEHDLFHECDVNATCTDTWGSYKCDCNVGFEGGGRVGKCKDIDECARENDCDENAECINNTGSYTCKCRPGYTGSGKDGDCVDVDECDERTHDCNEVMSTCTNNVGSFSCDCNDGFRKNDREECEDINECKEETHNCNTETSDCENNHGSYECICKDGYAEIAGINDLTCHDIDECASDNHNECHVNAACVNFGGGYNCTCDEGFVGDGFECENNERDECLLEIHNCDLTSTTCEDTPTGYNCNCKGSRYVQQDDFSCAFNITSCDSKQELGVVWQWGKRCKPTKNDWYYKGQDSVSLKCQVNNQHWRKAYTGFNIFAKIHCGTDFIKGLADGRIQYDIADKVELYQPGRNAYYRKGSSECPNSRKFDIWRILTKEMI